MLLACMWQRAGMLLNVHNEQDSPHTHTTKGYQSLNVSSAEVKKPQPKLAVAIVFPSARDWFRMGASGPVLGNEI